jgi:hypothetical protein
MANKNLLTYNAKVTQVEQVYFSPVAVLPPPFGTSISTTYCFLSHNLPWPDDNNPPQPTQDQKYIKDIFKSIFVVKQIYSGDISPVIQRIDWISGTTYDYYRDDVNMFQVNGAGILELNFYVRNRYDQVFKCLWNNNGTASTQEPFFQPGSYGTNNIYIGSDGYKWKYMYTIDTGLKRKFMDSRWIPVSVSDNTPNPIQSAAGFGDIEVINITNVGSGYDSANATITVTITGDGTGATATAETSGGQITKIVMANTGSNYTFANVSITSALGSGATAAAPISPIGGHGFDAVDELGCFNVMFTCEFDGSEGGKIPVDIDYRQVGLIVNPVSLSSYPNPASDPIYKTTTDLVVAPGFGAYVPDEVVYQGNSLDTATFSASVLSFSTASNVVYLINKVGTPILNAPVYSSSSGTVRTLLSVSYPDFQTFSGYLSYVENRTAIQRSFDGKEQFRFVLGY